MMVGLRNALVGNNESDYWGLCFTSQSSDASVKL